MVYAGSIPALALLIFVFHTNLTFFGVVMKSVEELKQEDWAKEQIYRANYARTLAQNTFTTAILASGLKVANFSSPHPFIFDDGTVLAACSKERAEATMLDTQEVETVSDCGRYADIELTFVENRAVRGHIQKAHADESIDIIIVPLPVLQARKATGFSIGKMRACRAGRVTKEICSNKFCK